MVQDPRIWNQYRALELGSQSSPSSRRRPQLLNLKTEPIASRLLEADSGPSTLEATTPRQPEAFSHPEGHRPLGPEPMEVDEPDPPGEGPYCPAPGVLR
jgi:hypothetical protein